MTYEEFLEENNVKLLTYISFANENTSHLSVPIQGNPIEYIDVAKNANILRLIGVPQTKSREFYENLRVFIENCRDEIEIEHGVLGKASKNEFIEAEGIINNLLNEINPNWSITQKLAYVHYKIGKLITYVPDYNYNKLIMNLPIVNDTKNIWYSLANGVSVCSGITKIEQNILARLGIETKELSSGIHSYLLTKTEEGNIITDVTWDLEGILYGAKPNYFGVTYEELCEQEAELTNAHRLKTPPENVVKIEDDELRDIYQSIGIIGEDRKFPLPILGKTREIESKEYSSINEKINAFFEMFITNFQEEAHHLCETRYMIEQCLEELDVEKEKITTKFVYSKKDMQCKNPYLIVHINIKNMRDKIFLLNIEEMTFKNIDIQDFDKQYNVHIYDTSKPFWKNYLKTMRQSKLDQNIK